MDEMRLQVNDIFLLINERFGKRFGEAQKSDLDELMEKMTTVSVETSKIRTSVQLTMIRLKALEQTVKSNGTVEKQIEASTPAESTTQTRRPSNISVHSTSSERKSRSGRSTKQRVLSEPNIQKKRERQEGKYATISGQQKTSSRPHSRTSLKSVDSKRHREPSRPPSREGILEEHVVAREEPSKFEYISATDDDVRPTEHAQTTQPTMPQDRASSSEEETILNDFEDESSSLTADIHDKKRQAADKKGKLPKQKSISKMPKTLADVFKKAKRKARLSSDSSQLSQRDDDTREVASEMSQQSQTVQPRSNLAPLAPRSDLSDTSYVTTDN
jgi:hypothetical protein